MHPSDYRRAQRSVHRGDEHEVGARNCASERAGSRVWTARDAVLALARHVENRTTLECVDCGELVDEWRGGYWQGTQEIVIAGKREVIILRQWEADHEVALEDGGRHEIENMRCRCVPCHKAKTARENSARAARRRAIDEAQAMVDAGQVSLLEATFIADALMGDEAA